MLMAITREVSASLARCELTHQPREPIDVEAARAEHDAYVECLRDLGLVVERLPALDDHPDAVFVEDPALVLDEVAILTRPGATSRRGEVEAIESALAAYRPIRRIEAPATLEGGDVLRIGRRLFVGLTSRTNGDGVRQLGELTAPFGYEVVGVEVGGCLHLKSACCALDGERALANPEWLDTSALTGVEIVSVPAEEPGGGNVLVIGESVIVPAAHPRTAERLAERGLAPVMVTNTELLKAESGVTCCSLVFEREVPPPSAA